MTVASYVAPAGDADEDNTPIIRELRRQVREGLTEDDANSLVFEEAQNEARLRLVVHEVV